MNNPHLAWIIPVAVGVLIGLAGYWFFFGRRHRRLTVTQSEPELHVVEDR